jgi:hypothetical protein
MVVIGCVLTRLPDFELKHGTSLLEWFVSRIHKLNAAAVVLLAVLFYKLLMFPKHDASLSKIIPFGDDPYDAIGSFAMIVCTMLALLSLGRAFWPHPSGDPAIRKQIYLVRTQMCAVLAIIITLVSDAVALARHPVMWTAAPERFKLLALLGGMAVFVTVIGLRIHCTKDLVPTRATGRWAEAVIVSLIGFLVLAAFPERLIEGTATHLLTIIVADLILFSAMRSWVTALVPYQRNEAPQKAAEEKSGLGSVRRWGVVSLVGILLGVFVFAGEMSEGTGHAPLAQTAFVAAVFVGLSVAGLAIAYAFLGKPLGLGMGS